jgi:hypothetical protein
MESKSLQALSAVSLSVQMSENIQETVILNIVKIMKYSMENDAAIKNNLFWI